MCVFFFAMSNDFRNTYTRIQELVDFMAWAITNKAIANVISQYGLAPLAVNVKKHVVDCVNTILCDLSHQVRHRVRRTRSAHNHMDHRMDLGDHYEQVL